MKKQILYDFLFRNFLNVKGNIKLIELNNPYCKVYVFDDAIWTLLRENILLKLYGDFEKLNGVIIDAGAHCGLFAIPASYYADEVVCIEASPLNVKILELNKIVNQRNNIKILPYALHRSKGIYKFKIASVSTDNRIDEEGTEIRTITLDEVLENYNEISLLKIDIEGAEFDVLLNTNPENLKKIKRIIGELHYKDENLKYELKNYLEKVGFSFIEKNDFINLGLNDLVKSIKNSKNIKNQIYYKFTNYLYILLPKLINKILIGMKTDEKITSFESIK